MRSSPSLNCLRCLFPLKPLSKKVKWMNRLKETLTQMGCFSTKLPSGDFSPTQERDRAGLGVAPDGEPKVLSQIAKELSALFSETQWQQCFQGGLCLKMASLLKFSKPYFPKKSVFLCGLRHQGDDSTGARVTTAIIGVIICVEVHLHSSPHSQCTLQLFLSDCPHKMSDRQKMTRLTFLYRLKGTKGSRDVELAGRIAAHRRSV